MQITERNSIIPTDNEQNYKQYPRRWVVIFLFALFCVANSIQWVQYTIIGDVIKKYYNVGDQAVNWTSLIWMILYTFLIFPATWLYKKIGLRNAILVGQGLNTLAAWIKVASVDPDLFWVTMIGQTTVASAQVYVLSTPSAVASVWFGSHEVSTACAIGVFGAQFGNLIGFLYPPLIVHDGTTEEIGHDLFVMFLSVAVFCTVIFLLIVIFLKNKPPTPPSVAQAQRERDYTGESAKQFAQTILRQLKKLDFLLLFIAYGINLAVFSAILTFINPMVLEQFPDAQQEAGIIGVILLGVGVTSSIVVGYILDKTRNYKWICFVIFSLSVVAIAAYTLLLEYSTMPYIYASSGLIGMFMISYLAAGYEFGVELTFPESEAMTTSVLAFGTQLIAFIVTYLYGIVIETMSAFASNWLMVIIQGIGAIISIFIPSNLRRQQAEIEAKSRNQ